MTCDCCTFRIQLMNLLKKILLTKAEGKQQWEMFEKFIKQDTEDNDTYSYYTYSYNARLYDRYMVNSHSCLFNHEDEDTSCSLKYFSLLAQKLDEIRRNYTALSSFLVDLISVLVNFWELPCVEMLWDSKRTACFSKERETFMLSGVLRWRGCSDFMKLLVNFGSFSDLSGDSPKLLREIQDATDVILYRIPTAPYRLLNSEQKEQLPKLMKVFFLQYEDSEIIKRMFLVTWALCGVRRKLKPVDRGWAEETINCLRMYFIATRDVYLSAFEVRSFLYAILSLARKARHFDTCCEEFHKLMPECPAKVEPRKLTHLARWQIRETLKVSQLPLSSAVEKLVLPNQLKSFLLGEIADLSRKSENISSENFVSQSELGSLLYG